MRKDFEKRLVAVEDRTLDWATKLDFVDYVGLTNYEDGNWEELHFDRTITVLRHRVTNEIRGVYADRRTDEEILSEGGSLEYL